MNFVMLRILDTQNNVKFTELKIYLKYLNKYYQKVGIKIISIYIYKQRILNINSSSQRKEK